MYNVLMVLTGNYGPYLSDDNVNVYITRDGGLNWEQVHARTHAYAMRTHAHTLHIPYKHTHTYHAHTIQCTNMNVKVIGCTAI